MTRTIVVACLLLSGCATFPLQQPFNVVQAEAQCTAEPFAVLGSCIARELDRHYPAWSADPQADLVQIYIAWLNAAGARIVNGSMSEVDARLGAATIKSRLRTEAGARYAAAEADRQSRFSAALAGLAVMQAAQTPQNVPSTTIYTVKGSQIVCNDYGRSVICN